MEKLGSKKANQTSFKKGKPGGPGRNPLPQEVKDARKFSAQSLAPTALTTSK